MVAMPIEPILHAGPFTWADLDAAPDDGHRYEVIDGVLLVSAAPGWLHQRAAGRLFAALLGACPSGLEVLTAPFEVALAEDSVVQPDVVVVRADQFAERGLRGAPVLAVEVLSGSTRLIDLNVKKARFERAGTPSFWVVDPVARPAEARLIAWELVDGAYQQVADVRGDSEYHATAPYPITVIPAALVR